MAREMAPDPLFDRSWGGLRLKVTQGRPKESTLGI